MRAADNALAALAIALLVMLAASALPCQRAHASFRDAADSFPAAQELGEYGDPIYGDQLPDGTYKVTARTTSRMCIMYTNPEDAEARDSKEQAVVSVSGGDITAVFYLSKAYTHLYRGTQEEAAAATDEAGADASAYIPGDPDEGYVPHLFAVSIPALNVPVTMSTYSGGDRGIASGKWYTRQMVFAMTEAEFLAAKAEAGQDGEGQVPEQGESPASEEAPSGQVALGADNVGSGAGGAPAGGFGEGAGDGGAEPAQPEPAPEQAPEQAPAPAPEPEPAPEPAPAAPADAEVRGTRMAIPASGIDLSKVEVDAVGQDEAQRPLLASAQKLALAAAFVFAAGVALRLALFARSRERPGRGGEAGLGVTGAARGAPR